MHASALSECGKNGASRGLDGGRPRPVGEKPETFRRGLKGKRVLVYAIGAGVDLGPVLFRGLVPGRNGPINKSATSHCLVAPTHHRQTSSDLASAPVARKREISKVASVVATCCHG